MTRLLPIALLLALTLTGCSRETAYRNLYEGMRTQSELQNLHEDSRREKSSKSYDQYRLERRDRLSNEQETENR